jgi:oxygen-independent coproporphyrinogen-3 oxidase
MSRDLAARGFDHYEISNWARPGREARHNRKYWSRTPTLGLGVSAHELWGGRRRANVANLEGYLGQVEAGRRPLAFDLPVTPEEAAREEIFLGLRVAEGVPVARIEAFVTADGDVGLWNDYETWLAEGVLERRGDRVCFTERGYLISNEVLSRFV